jgi:hypothetical protein
MVQMPSVGPERWNATRVPSGDQAGAVSVVAESSLRLAVRPEAGLTMRTSSRGPAPAARTNAIRPFLPAKAAPAESWGPGTATRTPASRASRASRLVMGRTSRVTVVAP